MSVCRHTHTHTHTIRSGRKPSKVKNNELIVTRLVQLNHFIRVMKVSCVPCVLLYLFSSIPLLTFDPTVARCFGRLHERGHRGRMLRLASVFTLEHATVEPQFELQRSIVLRQLTQFLMQRLQFEFAPFGFSVFRLNVLHTFIANRMVLRLLEE